MDKEARNQIFDISRGLGIFLVVWGHVTSNPASIYIYSFHMPLFFFLSGIFHRNEQFTNFLNKKFKRLIIPYLYYSILIYLFYLAWFSVFLEIESFNFKNILNIIPFNDTVSSPLWFLISLFEVSLIFFLLELLFKNDLILTFLAILLGLILVLISKKVEVFVNYFFIASSCSMLMFFSLGHLIARFKSMLVTKKQHFIIIIFILFMASFLLLNLHYNNKVDVRSFYFGEVQWVFPPIAILGIIVTLLGSIILGNIPILAKVLSYLGINSLGIFIIHLPLFEFARPMAKLIITKEETFSYGLLTAIICLGFAVVANAIILKVVPQTLGK